MTKRLSTKPKFFTKVILALAFVLSLSTICGVLINTNSVYAYSEKQTWSNLNFADNNNLSNVYTNPTGWKLGVTENKSTSGAINLDKFNDSFYLDAEQVPEKLSDSADDHVLMINSKSATSTVPTYQYYTNSNSLTLDAYSNYKLVVWTKVLPGARASVYVTGLEEDLGYENISANIAGEWTSFTFYITTGSDKENIKTELWLGARPTTTSNSAVFFDNISVLKLSNDLTPSATTNKNSLVSTPTSYNDNVKYVNLDERSVVENFESANISKWSKTISQMKNGTYAEVLNLKTNSTSIAKGITYVGLDNTKNNTNALVLYTEDDVKSYFGLKSKPINIDLYETFKISVNVKVADIKGGSAYVKFVEEDIRFGNADPDDESSNIVEAITPINKEIAISSNSSNKMLNDYTTCTFYVKGRSLYKTSYRLELWLGSSSAETSGVAVFDNILVEPISDDAYQNAETSSYAVKVELQDKDGDYGITNATFNAVKKAEKELTYPLIPENWEHNVSDKEDVFFGVVNTYSPVYEETKNQFGNFANPGNPQGFLNVDNDTNNILLLHNYNKAYQSITSSSFNIEANKYYNLSFNFKQLTNDKVLNVYVQDENGSVLYADENITSTNPQTWETYKVCVSTNSYTNQLKIIISLGTKENLVTGVLYLDNVTLMEDKNLTKEEYIELSKENNVLDFQEGNFNLIKHTNSSISEPLRYTGSLEVGEGESIANGGIIDGNNTEDEFNIENAENNTNSLKHMMMIQTHGKATYSFTAKDGISLSADSYYKFTVSVKTVFGSSAKNQDEIYGAEFGLTGLDQKISGIVTNEWKEYTIYVKATEAVTANLRFALNSANYETAGMVYFDNYSYEKVDADVYNVAKLNNEDNNTFLFVGNTDKEEEPEDNKSGADLTYIWYVIPTLILAFALIFALITAVMKKVKIKKWEKRKVNEYDRTNTVHRDVIRAKAEKFRDAKVRELQTEISSINEKLASMEEAHKEHLKQARLDRTSGVSKQAEKEYKQYAKVRTTLQNKVAGLQSEIENMNTAEYLLAVQHKLAVEKAKEERLDKEKSYSSKKNKK